MCGHIPKHIADIAAGVVSMRFGAKGPNFATISACSTSAHAIGEAFRTIMYGDADVMIAGGSEAAVLPMAIGGFGNMTALSVMAVEAMAAAIRRAVLKATAVSGPGVPPLPTAADLG